MIPISVSHVGTAMVCLAPLISTARITFSFDASLPLQVPRLPCRLESLRASFQFLSSRQPTNVVLHHVPPDA
jgi:hypothetical protein